MNESTSKIKPEWFKIKGYLHITPNISSEYSQWSKIRNQIENKHYVSNYSFFPLIHTNIIERRYKNVVQFNKKKNEPYRNIEGKIIYSPSHKQYDTKTNQYKTTAKKRPIHYATHKDSLIFSYYAYLLNNEYKKILSANKQLDNAVTAYRKIFKKVDPHTGKDIGKSTIDFAFEVFDEIMNRSLDDEVAVLAFDIKSFFSSLNHIKIKDKWEEVMKESSDFSSFEESKDHQKVFKACTQFNYILHDNFRVGKKSYNGKKAGFDESKLASIRKNKGIKSFFESSQDFRNNLRSGKIKVFKNPFWDKQRKCRKGIPQGLPISATLANIYLLDFDRSIISNLVNDKDKNCLYRRYSDDIIIVCDPKDISEVQNFVINEMSKNFVEISIEKTEIFIFKQNAGRITSHKLIQTENNNYEEIPNSPLKYLGFEFRGYNKNIKSGNIGKFYRKMISVVKRRSRRAKRAIAKNPLHSHEIFFNQIEKLYNNSDRKPSTDSNDKKRSRKKFNLKFNVLKGFYEIEHVKKSENNNLNNKNSNYNSYVSRSAKIMEEQNIRRQLSKQDKILKESVDRNFK